MALSGGGDSRVLDYRNSGNSLGSNFRNPARSNLGRLSQNEDAGTPSTLSILQEMVAPPGSSEFPDSGLEGQFGSGGNYSSLGPWDSDNDGFSRDELDAISRVTTGRPTIVIYPTGEFNFKR